MKSFLPTLEQGAMDESLKGKNQSWEKEPTETDTQGEDHIENEAWLSSKLNTTYKASSVSQHPSQDGAAQDFGSGLTMFFWGAKICKSEQKYGKW